MIGIMKPAYNKHTDHDLLKEQHWLNYCASCKSIGNEYGQIYRAGLSYDLALLGQLASDAAGITFDKDTVKPRKCFKKADFEDNSKELMRYIAALHMFWFQAKIKDNAEDENTWYWRWLNARSSPKFEKAQRDLIASGVDLEWIEEMLMNQHLLEQNATATQNDIHIYAHVSGLVTGHFFRQAVVVAGEDSQAEQFDKLGFEIGQALYITDAAEDLEEDLLRGRFNPFELLQNLSQEQKKSAAKKEAVNAWNKVTATIETISLSELTKQQLTTRIDKIRNQIYGACCNSSCGQATFTQKIKAAAATVSAALIPTALSAQSVNHASASGFDDCFENFCGCCCLICICGCCSAVSASPSSAGNCACDCCCQEDPNCRWY